MDKSQLFELSISIAQHLPGIWTIAPDEQGHDSMSLTRTEQPLGLYINAGREKGKLQIGGISEGLSNQLPYSVHFPSIGVSVNKSPACIASDISRRLLPEFEPMLLAARASKADYLRREAEQLARVQAIVDASGGWLYHNADTRYGGELCIYNKGSNPSVKCRCHSTYVTLELTSLPYELAASVLAFIHASLPVDVTA